LIPRKLVNTVNCPSRRPNIRVTPFHQSVTVALCHTLDASDLSPSPTICGSTIFEVATMQQPKRPAQRVSSGKDILSRMLQMEKQSKVSSGSPTNQTIYLQTSSAQFAFAGIINRTNSVSATTSLISKPYNSCLTQSRLFQWINPTGITFTYKISKISFGDSSITSSPPSTATLSNITQLSLQRAILWDA